MGARDLNKTQIGDIGNHASAIGIEKHYLHIRVDSRGGHGLYFKFQVEVSRRELKSPHRRPPGC